MNYPELRHYRPVPYRHRQITVDLLVYSANSGGIISAIAASRRGLKVCLANPSQWIGGLTAGGLSLTDIGNKHAIGGLAREFYRRVGRHYGVEEHWRFEPHVAEKVFAEWLEEEGITVESEEYLADVVMDGTRIREVKFESGLEVRASMFIDASYEGDLMAAAGVSFTVGREDNSLYGETVNGSQIHHTHQFELPVSPFVRENDPSSGLLPGIESEEIVIGRGDHRVQAYNFRLCLTDRDENRLDFERPDDYDPSRYELLARYCRAGFPITFEKFDPLVNGKVDKNNHGAVSTDYIGANYAWPTASHAEREEIFQAHVSYIKGLLWFWKTDPVANADFQEPFQKWGYCRDEFQATGGFSNAIYVREARRMVSDHVMTEHDCFRRKVAEDSVALAAYQLDSHNCRRVVRDGALINEGDVQLWAGPPYPISYRSLIPKRGEAENLFVTFALSASHIAFGSIRMEPVFMILGESAAIAASLTLQKNLPVQDLPYGDLEPELLGAGQNLSEAPPVQDMQSGE